MLRVSLLFTVVMLLPFAVSADERASGFSVGIGAGIANTDFDRGFAASDTALSAFAAYDFNRYLSVEASYVDAGSPEEDGVTVKVSYVTMMAVGSWPLWRRWSIFARAGAITGSWESSGVERDDTNLAFGAGSAVDFRQFRVRLIADTAQIDDATVVHLSIQGAWRF
jgi:hypothetical protein